MNNRRGDIFQGKPLLARFVLMLLTLVIACLFAGCSILPNSVSIETEHVSHPLAGYPFGPANEEDALDQLNIAGTWNKGGAYVQHGLGYKLTDSGFYGPRFTYTLRAGYTFKVKKGDR